MTKERYRVLREPKGGADAVVVGTESEIPTLTRTANILSVQGFTCRIICLELDADIRSIPDALVPKEIPRGTMRGIEETSDTAAEEIAAKLLKEIMNHANL